MYDIKDCFDDFLVERNGEIYELAADLLRKLECSGRIYEIDKIAPVVEVAESVLSDACYPFFGDNETPCYLTGECKREDCLFKIYAKERGFEL